MILRLTLAFVSGTLFALWLLSSSPVSADPCAPGTIQPHDMPSRWVPIPYSEVTPLPPPLPYQPAFVYPQGRPNY